MTPQQSESRDLDKVIVRLPDGMRERLKAAAAENKRSMNAEIVARLEDTLEGATVVMPTDMRNRIEASAVRNGRDFPSELWSTLEAKYPPPPPDLPHAEAIDAAIALLAKTFGITSWEPDETDSDAVRNAKVVYRQLLSDRLEASTDHDDAGSSTKRTPAK